MKPKSRAAAVLVGAPRYNNGRPCAFGHRADRITANYSCVECDRESRSAYYKTEKGRAAKRKWEHLPASKIRAMLYSAKTRAKKAGVPFNLTSADIQIPTHCPVLGIPLSSGLGKNSHNSPSLDRLIPQLGYVRGNIAVISHRANQIKSDSSCAELRAILAWIEKLT